MIKHLTIMWAIMNLYTNNHIILPATASGCATNAVTSAVHRPADGMRRIDPETSLYSSVGTTKDRIGLLALPTAAQISGCGGKANKVVEQHRHVHRRGQTVDQ